jgi:hypothetical protein
MISARKAKPARVVETVIRDGVGRFIGNVRRGGGSGFWLANDAAGRSVGRFPTKTRTTAAVFREAEDRTSS